MKSVFMRAVCAAWFCIALAAQPSAAQSLYGTLVGNVTDGSGATIPGATVTATQAETNLTRDVTTNATGAYSIPNIPSGTYTVVVTLPGFETFTAKGVTVTNRDVRVDAKLGVGALQESVSVSATASILQTENAAVQHMATSEQMETLPTSGRAFASFLTLMPGVAQPDYQQSGGINNPGRTMAIAINGQPATNTVVRLDGVTASNQYLEGLQTYSPSLEAIETVNVTTSSMDADQGMAGAASVNVQVKSGTNAPHGSAFEFGNDARLRARAHFLPAGQSKGTSSVHVLGGTLGGPIVRNKLFFFFSDETTRQRTFQGNAVGQTGTNGFVSIPTNALRAGDFSGTGTVLYDPLTGTATGTGRTPFAFANCPGLASTTDPGFAACNYIPAARLNPIAQRMLSLLVQPTQPGFTNNYFVTTGYDSTFHKIDGKITYAAGPKLNVNGRIGLLPSWERAKAILPSVDGSDFNPLSQGREWNSFVNSHSIGATSILSKNFVVDGVFGYTKHNVHVFPPEHQCAGALVGIPNSCQPPYSLDTAIPVFTVTGWLLNGTSPIRDYQDPQYQLSGNAGYTIGSHSIKFGGDYVHLAQNHYETQVPEFTFNGGLTSLSGGTAANNFNRLADFLLGLPSARSAQAMSPLLGDDASGADPDNNTFLPATLRSRNVGVYLRDQWQINSKITASIGLRWEYYSLPERADHGIEIYDFATNKLQICGAGTNTSACDVNVEKNLFTPRVGVAYRPTETMVIRAGFSRNPQSNNPGRQQLPPSQAFPQTIIITQNAPNNFSAIGNLSDGSPVVQQLDLSSGQVSLPAGAGVNTFRGDYVRGKISSWNVSVQKALGQRMSAQVAYVANRQDDITRNQNLNYGQLGGGTASQPFQPIGITSAMNVFAPLGKVKYDSVQLSFNRRMSEGLQFTAAYTFSKTIDWWAAGNNIVAIPAYYELNKGETGSPSKLNASLIYELPFGSGRKFLNNDGIVSKLAGGWQVNTFFSYTEGTLVTVTSNANILNAPGTALQFADKVKDGDVQIIGQTTPTGQYFDVSAFRSVSQVRFGNAGLNNFRGPAAPNVDMSLFRTFHIGRDRTLQLRAECFNITNTVHYANPSATALNISNATFNADGSIANLNGVGSINDVVRLGRQYDEREWRFGLRFGF